MRQFNTYISDSDRTELGKRFADAVHAMNAQNNFPSKADFALNDPLQLFNELALKMLMLVDSLKLAIKDAANEKSDAVKAKIDRDRILDDVYMELRLVANAVTAALWRDKSVSAQEGDKIYSDIFPFGTVSAIKRKLNSFSDNVSQVLSALDNYPKLKKSVDLSELNKAFTSLRDVEKRLNKERVEDSQARKNLVVARNNFDEFWSAVSDIVKGVSALYNNSDVLVPKLLADKDKTWLAGRTAYKPKVDATNDNPDTPNEPESDPTVE